MSTADSPPTEAKPEANPEEDQTLPNRPNSSQLPTSPPERSTAMGSSPEDQIKVTLPDGNEVWLPRSSIALPDQQHDTRLPEIKTEEPDGSRCPECSPEKQSLFDLKKPVLYTRLKAFRSPRQVPRMVLLRSNPCTRDVAPPYGRGFHNTGSQCGYRAAASSIYSVVA